MKFKNFFKSSEQRARDYLAKDAAALEQFYEERGFKVPVKKAMEQMLKEQKVEFTHGLKATGGFFDPGENSISVPGDTNEESSYVRIHEIAHATSLNRKVESDDRKIGRSGVGTYAGLSKSGEHQEWHGFFLALNEAITAAIARKATLDKRDFLTRFFFRSLGRRRERALLDHVIKNLSLFENAGRENIENDIIAVFLDGWSPEFKRRLRSAFGPHVLKILAIVDT